MQDIYIGLMSGTSMDAIDVAAVNFGTPPFQLLGTHSEPLPEKIMGSLHALCDSGDNEIDRLGALDRQVGLLFASACNTLLEKLHLSRQEVIAIGSHGQTIRHQPRFEHPFTLQIGDPNVIAEKTGITTIADFRRRDMACGGQGAPLTPAFHHFAFNSPDKNRVVVNIGGIANLTFLPVDNENIRGFDSGPGNTLLDCWIRMQLNKKFDAFGTWAAGGALNKQLLERLLQDPFFELMPPKSTGREYFNLAWLKQKIIGLQIAPQDVQTTLTELTALTIIQEVNRAQKDYEILLCGGGVYNKELLKRLSSLKGPHQLFTTAAYGADPRWVEAIAFAWLARQTLNRLPGNVPEVTGATHPAILGGIFLS